MENKRKLLIISAFICVIFVLVAIGFEVIIALNNNSYLVGYSDVQAAEGTETQKYESFEEVIYEDDLIICYKDKVVNKYSLQKGSSRRTAEIVKGIVNECQKLENIYVLPMPNYILINDERVEENNIYTQYINSLRSYMPEKAVVIDPLPNLKEHKSEYIYFNTTDVWTPRGAYYSLQAASEIMGINMISLDEFYEYTYSSFDGELVHYDKLKEMAFSEQVSDSVYYYVLPGTRYEVEVTKKVDDTSDELLTYKKPLITPSYKNTSMFIDTSYEKAVVAGNSIDGNHSGEYLLVVCDGAGDVMVPFLKDYYDGVIVVSVVRNPNFRLELNELVEKYNITDLLYVQNSMKMGVHGYTNALNLFCNQVTYEE